MATAMTPPIFLTLLFFFIVSGGGGGGILRIAKGQTPDQGAWCVAKPSSSDDELTNNINYICTQENLSCDIIQPGGPCFEPQTLINHASVVMNLYYQRFGRNYWNCDFTHSGIVTVKDPTYGACKYRFAQ